MTYYLDSAHKLLRSVKSRSADPFRILAHGWVLLLVLSAFSRSLIAQPGPQTPSQELQAGLSAARATPGSQPPVPLTRLLKEAERNNPQIIAARRAWQAAALVPSQASALPDPELTVQQFSVGSPRPFAGFTNSNFAYIGFGVSQEVPYPGKLRLRGEIAKRGADVTRDQFESVRRGVIEQLKTAYFKLSDAQQMLSILRRDQKLLSGIEEIAEARYRVGQGNQADVLKAQLQETKLLRDLQLYEQQKETFEARLKQLLNRPPESADIAAEEMTQTPFAYSFDQLRSLVARQNPGVRAQQDVVSRHALAVELAKKDFYPDFDVQYMWQHTAEQFRDYYMLTFGVQVPIHWRRKQRPALAQAAEDLDSSRRSYEAQVQETYFEIRDQYLAAETAARVLTIYRQGLIPQATAAFKAGLASYQTGKEDFETLLDSFRDVLNLDTEYWRTLADHETALAKLEQLTGITLP